MKIIKKKFNDWVNSSKSPLAMMIRERRMLKWYERIKRNGGSHA